jgi:hypothetical protein
MFREDGFNRMTNGGPLDSRTWRRFGIPRFDRVTHPEGRFQSGMEQPAVEHLPKRSYRRVL